jgi:indole-3-glycerol phosphate synthase
MFLDDILTEKKKQIKESKSIITQNKLLAQLETVPQTKHFKRAIAKPNRINLVAEIKKASPSCGVIRENFDPLSIAKIYQENNVDAISVLTEEKFFKGKLSYLNDIKKITTLPILRKDFIIDEYQIYESAAAGSDAILLISGILSKAELARFATIANKFNMDVVIEVYTQEDLKKALSLDVEIIGINNRDLQTFEVDIDTTSRLIKLIPKDKTILSESGINNYKTVMYLKDLGINAVLIGEAFMAARDIGAKIKEVMRISDK